MTRTVYDATPDGEMTLAGRTVSSLIAEFGSPLVVLLEDEVRSACRAYRTALEHDPRSRVHYASKAFLTTGFCRLIEEEGMCLDVVSWGELHTALAAGFPAERILLHGNAKTMADLELAVSCGVGRIVIDNLSDIELLAALVEGRDTPVDVLVRITPGVKPSTHAYVQTGQIDSKFGFNLAGGLAEDAVRRVLAVPGLRLVGLHCHIGSQILSLDPYALTARTMLDFYAHAKKTLGAPLEELNLGGGIGIDYGGPGEPPSIVAHVRQLRQVVQDHCATLGIEPPALCDEPGRSIVGQAGVTLYTVQSVKVIPGVRNYAGVDGGMTDNPRFALYGARHPFVVASRLHDPADQLWSIAGRCCETGDMLIQDAPLPALRRGDVLAALATGAYTWSMASNYNRIARPAVVLVGPGRAALLAARETADDLIRLDRIPSWLERPRTDHAT